MANRIILGRSNLGLEGRESAFGLLDAYVDLGGTDIDTASVYSGRGPGQTGRSETIIGEWIRARGRGRVSIATNGAHPAIGDVHRPRSDACSIRHDVDLSLKRLGVDALDLWYFHRDDPSRPVAEMVAPSARLGTCAGTCRSRRNGRIPEGLRRRYLLQLFTGRINNARERAGSTLGNMMSYKVAAALVVAPAPAL